MNINTYPRYNFVDAREINKVFPRFAIPHYSELKSIQKYNTVKIIHNGERIWVDIQKREGNLLTGVVDNDLVSGHPFKYGYVIVF